MKYNYIILVAFLSIIVILGLLTCSKNYSQGYIPDKGFVPNESTAIKIAEAIWLPIFGDDIYKSLPFKAKLINDTLWVVEGTLPKNKLGGVPYIQILKSNCRILDVSYGM
jgi:hypothetical protein